MQLSKLKERINVLQVSNRSPSILQSLNFTSRNVVLVSFTRLKLQPENSHSINFISVRSAFEKSQLLKMQFSYSPFLSGFVVKLFLSKVLSSVKFIIVMSQGIFIAPTNLQKVNYFEHQYFHHEQFKL